jgi:hypothetical protein
MFQHRDAFTHVETAIQIWEYGDDNFVILKEVRAFSAELIHINTIPCSVCQITLSIDPIREETVPKAPSHR